MIWGAQYEPILWLTKRRNPDYPSRSTRDMYVYSITRLSRGRSLTLALVREVFGFATSGIAVREDGQSLAGQRRSSGTGYLCATSCIAVSVFNVISTQLGSTRWRKQFMEKCSNVSTILMAISPVNFQAPYFFFQPPYLFPHDVLSRHDFPILLWSAHASLHQVSHD